MNDEDVFVIIQHMLIQEKLAYQCVSSLHITEEISKIISIVHYNGVLHLIEQ